MRPFTPAPLELAWQPCLANSLRTPVRAADLPALVERQSRLYNGEAEKLTAPEQFAARVLFFLPRDVHKPALPLAELAALGALDGAPLRVLDVGAGVGASALGVLRTHAQLALTRATLAPLAHLLAVDHDALALAHLPRLAKAARDAGLLPAEPGIETREGDLRAPSDWLTPSDTPFDLIVLGTALVELTRGAGDEVARGAAIASLLEPYFAPTVLSPRGVLVVLEPASRAESRALQYARTALLEKGKHLVGPCTHAGACPLLERSHDWCHQDVPVDLPRWLVPVAQAAGLRYQGLTFSYLSLSARAGVSVSALTPPGRVGLRLVSEPRATKGKSEATACGAVREGVTGVTLMQLERDLKKTPVSARLEGALRGQLVGLASERAAECEPRGVVRVRVEELGM